jgi:transposase
LGYTPVVPPKKNRTHPWEYDKTLYRKTLYRKTLYRKTLYRKTLYRKTLYRKTLYRKTLYRRRNEVERPVRRLKGFRRVFTGYDKPDALYLGFILFAIIFDALRSVNTR